MNWEKRAHRRGVFGDYTVVGFRYEGPNREIGWHVTSWRNGHDLIHDCWISGKTFHSMTIHYSYKGTNRTLIEIFQAITNLDSEEQKAVLEAIVQWTLHA